MIFLCVCQVVLCLSDSPLSLSVFDDKLAVYLCISAAQAAACRALAAQKARGDMIEIKTK